MKTSRQFFSTAGFVFMLLVSVVLHAQHEDSVDGGVFSYGQNDALHPCISPQEYAQLDREVADNLKTIPLVPHTSKNILTTTFIWPLRPKTGFTQCEYHFIGAFVDQNTAATAIQDFNCETNTYDGHQGTDIAIWPYGFYKMDNSQIEVVAAAPGIIVQRADGNFDRNCASNSLTANSIIIQHADGSQALYWHMKQNSVTTKTVGQTVVAGEYLGIVGSSGSSTGPHLHFEVRSGSTSASYKDPYSGSCNALNANSWWVAQKPHTDPALVKVSVNTTDIALATCPNSDVPTESDTFLVPFQGAGLSPGYAKFYVFLREIPANTVLSMRILHPNGTVFNSWNYTITTFYKVSYWGFSKLLPTTDGTYTFEATYNGVSCARPFTITHSLGIATADSAHDLLVYPNPAHTDFVLQADGLANGDYTCRLTTLTGQLLEVEKLVIADHRITKTFSVNGLSNGIYFLTLEDASTRIIKKIIKH